MKKINIIFSVILTVTLLFAVIPSGVYAASAAILSATDGTNFLVSSQQDIVSYTVCGADITLLGFTVPAYAETAIKVRSASDNNKVMYVRQKKSDSLGSFSFSFSTQNYPPDTYEIIVSTEGSISFKTKYFTIAPPQAPTGAGNVFDCFTVNGKKVSFDKSKFAAVKMSPEERNYAPVLDVSTVDKTARVEIMPAVVPNIPCAVKVKVYFKNGTSQTYSLILDEFADRRVTDLVKAQGAGECIIEDDIRLGASTENASLVYSDRNNVFWYDNSSWIFEGATQIRRAKGDAAGFVSDDTEMAGVAKVSNKPYYGGAFSGQNGEPYWLSFVVHADCTVYMADPHSIGWPNNDGTWKNDSGYRVSHKGGGASANSQNLYYKKFTAGDRVNIPNYGLKEGWPDKGVRVYDPPAYAVVWDSNGSVVGTDADLKKLSYSLDNSETTYDVTDFSADNDTYVIKVPGGTSKVKFDAEKSDPNSVISTDLLVELGNATVARKEINVVSSGGIIEKTYTVLIKTNDGVYGDVDGDGDVTGDDAMWTLRYELGLQIPQSINFEEGDVDCDGEITGDDAMWILRYELGLSIPVDIRIG